MTKREELDLFIGKANELLDSQYILADIKIVGLLKAIASSETLVAIFKNCLSGFDYDTAQKKYLVKSPYLADSKGEFIVPSNPKDLLAFVFSVLMELDSKNLNFSDFIKKYFYEDGSFSASYASFLTKMISPFINTVNSLMESVIDGKVQDPVEALMEEEAKLAKKEEEEKLREQKEKELSQKTYGESIKALKEILLKDKTKIKDCGFKNQVKDEIILAIDMLANVVDSGDADALNYAYVCYKYVVKAHPITLRGRINKVKKLIDGIINEL